MPRTRSGWKKYERMVARMAGGKRIPVTGRAGQAVDPGDVALAGWYVEVRDQKRPRPIRWFFEILLPASAHHTSPVLVFNPKRAGLGPLCIMRWKDFQEVLRRDRPARAPGHVAGAPREGSEAG